MIVNIQGIPFKMKNKKKNQKFYQIYTKLKRRRSKMTYVTECFLFEMVFLPLVFNFSVKKKKKKKVCE